MRNRSGFIGLARGSAVAMLGAVGIGIAYGPEKIESVLGGAENRYTLCVVIPPDSQSHALISKVSRMGHYYSGQTLTLYMPPELIVIEHEREMPLEECGGRKITIELNSEKDKSLGSMPTPDDMLDRDEIIKIVR